MLILGIDSSALAASAAVWDGKKVLSQCTVNNHLTHSQTLLPLIEHTLTEAGLSLKDIGLLAVSTGPGSFTGLRIGLATVKGLCAGSGLPCLGVSTLEALAWNLQGFDGIACSVMDARVKQVYQGSFALVSRKNGGTVTRVGADRAVSLEELAQKVKACEKNVYLVGDGADLCYNSFGRELEHVFLAPAHLRWQQGANVARLAGHLLEQGAVPLSPGELFPSYLRLSQAERERQAKLNSLG